MDCGISHPSKPVQYLAQHRWQSHENRTRDLVRFVPTASKQNEAERAWLVCWPAVSLPWIPAMATPQIRRKPLTHQTSLCNNLLTISTRHGISSTHGSVTIWKVAHSDRQSRSQDATNRKREKTLRLFFIFFFLLLLF
jgi:hypothetical protein